jgi:chaperone modulatory protein CbpM
MPTEQVEPQWADDERRVGLRDLADLSGLSEVEVRELVEYGALIPAEEAGGQWIFSVRSIAVARTAHRLREDFELELHGISLLLAYLDRIHDLEAELCALRAKLPR